MNPVDKRPGFLARHPWLFVLAAFLILIGAWSSLITVAVSHSPERIEPSAESAPETEPDES